MGDFRKRVLHAGRDVIQPGEPVLATVRAATEGSPLGALGGVLLLTVLAADARSDAEAKGFPASMNMILAVTDRRLLVFRRRLFGRTGSRSFRGHVPLEWLSGVTLERRGLSPRLRFALTSGVEVTFTTYRVDRPNVFVETVDQARQAWSHIAPPIPPSAPPVVPPPPLSARSAP